LQGSFDCGFGPEQGAAQVPLASAHPFLCSAPAGWFSLNVPSGLTLYWFVNNIISTGQQASTSAHSMQSLLSCQRNSSSCRRTRCGRDLILSLRALSRMQMSIAFHAMPH
jgi:hypothetical protein